MKKSIIVLTIILGLLMNSSYSQEWAPIGATWHYSVNGLKSYVKIVSEGDTLIEGKVCRMLSKTRFTKNPPDYENDTVFLGYEYTWPDNDKVHIYKYGQFYVLFDFSAQPGDSWVIPGLVATGFCDSTGVVQVDSIGETIINGENLRVIYHSAAEGSHWAIWGSVIIEKIGPVDSYMLSTSTIDCGYMIMIEGGPLRCYSDNDFGEYSTGIAPECNYIVGVNDTHIVENTVQVFPNPADREITILSNQYMPDNIEIFDVYGESLKKINTNEKRVSIDISGFPNGVYFIKINYENDKSTLKFIKK